MFQIPDDDEDDEFWKEFPLEDFENSPASKGEKRQGSPLQEEHKKPCTRNIENVISKRLIPNSGFNPPNGLPATISNKNCPLQDVSLSNNQFHTEGTYQKTGAHSENSEFSGKPSEKYQAVPLDIFPNYSIRQQQQTPQNDRCPRRKFPGPAGMLPRLVPGQKLTDNVMMKLDARGDRQLQKNESLSSNCVEDFFGESPWLKMVNDLGEDSLRILKTFSIKELQIKACKKQLYQGKVLLLFTILETVDLSSIDASVRLCDRTGSIQGTIHRNLVKEYGEHLQPGTVLVLKQVGVLSPTPRTHYLNITANNLVTLYSTLPSGQVGIHWQEEGITYRQLVTNAEEILQKSQICATPTRHPHHFIRPVESPSVKDVSTMNRHLSSIERNSLQNFGTSKNSMLNSQTNVCDKISGFPLQKLAVPFGTPKSTPTPRNQYPSHNQGDTSFLNKELSKANPDVPPKGRSRWAFKSVESVSKQIPGPSSSSYSSFDILSLSASNTGALNSSLNSSCHTFVDKNLGSQAPVSSALPSNGVSVSVSTWDKYHQRADNCPSITTTTKTTSNVSEIWQDDLSDDILSQLSEDLF